MTIPVIISTIQQAIADPATIWGRHGDLLRAQLTDASVGLAPFGFPVSLVADDPEIRDLLTHIAAKNRQRLVRSAARIAWRLHEQQGVRTDIANQAVNCYILAGHLPDARLPVDASQGPDRRGRPWTYFWVLVATVLAWLSLLACLGGAGWWWWDRFTVARVAAAVAILGIQDRPLRDRVLDPAVQAVASRPEVQRARETASAAYAQSVVAAFDEECARTDPFTTTWEAHLLRFDQVFNDPLLTTQARHDLERIRDREMHRRGGLVEKRLMALAPAAAAPLPVWDAYLSEVDKTLSGEARYIPPGSLATITALRSTTIISRATVVMARSRALAAPEALGTLALLTKARDELAVLERDPLLPEDRRTALGQLAAQVRDQRGGFILAQLRSTEPGAVATFADIDRFYRDVSHGCEARDVPLQVQTELEHLLARAGERRTDLMVKQVTATDPGSDAEPATQLSFINRLMELAADRTLTDAARQRLQGLAVDRGNWCEARLRTGMREQPDGEHLLSEDAWAPLFVTASSYGALRYVPTDKVTMDHAARLIRFRDNWFVRKPHVLRIHSLSMARSSHWSPSFSKPTITLSAVVAGISYGEVTIRHVLDDATMQVNALLRPETTWGAGCQVVADDHDGHRAVFQVTVLTEKLHPLLQLPDGEPGLSVVANLDDAGPHAVPVLP
ncbi:MAG: hypothetical protein H0X38_04320 [Planctomycetes bacterium]|nr:hypothetical protein [Planctomycetota bacterium]